MYKITPTHDKRVIDPSTGQAIQKDGIMVKHITSYFINRERDGDITIVEVKPKNDKKTKGE